jgi:ribosomal protein L11 methyltransferase
MKKRELFAHVFIFRATVSSHSLKNMDYKEILIKNDNEELNEILIALLSASGIEGFEETDDALKAFLPASDLDERLLAETLKPYNVSYTIADIKKTNWNKEWEQNFEPVVVSGFCTVRADFHDMNVETPYEIVIMPKMSFGTGHHATTQLMMQMMQHMKFEGKTVLDFGTGTGILAILATMLGAGEVLAIDNDEWSVENAKENITKNHRSNITVQQGSLEPVNSDFDVVLANINRNILLQYMQQLASIVNSGGTILMSGILQEDKDIIVETAKNVGFSLEESKTEKNWMALKFFRE